MVRTATLSSWIMPPSQLLSLRLAAAAGLVLASDPAPELRVLRVVPAEVGSPGTVVTVTFDRPVAGSLVPHRAGGAGHGGLA